MQLQIKIQVQNVQFSQSHDLLWVKWDKNMIVDLLEIWEMF